MTKTRQKDLKLAYIISAYKLFKNLERLVNALDNGNSTFVICVDRHTNLITYKKMKTLLKSKNVHFLPRHNSVYRSFGHIKTTLKGMSYLEDNNISYDYVSLLTGQDYPIKSSKELQNYFKKNYGLSYMEFFQLPTDHWEYGGLDRLDRYHIHTRKGRFSINRDSLPFIKMKEIPYGLKPWGGSGYWSLYKEHAKYIVKFVKEHPDYVKFFRHVDIPDEIFFHSILLNSKLKNKIINDDLRYTDWSKPGETPAIIRRPDLNLLKSSKDVFARKFDINVDPDILDIIDNRILKD